MHVVLRRVLPGLQDLQQDLPSVTCLLVILAIVIVATVVSKKNADHVVDHVLLMGGVTITRLYLSKFIYDDSF